MKNLKISWKVVTSEGFWMFIIMGVVPFSGFSFASFTNPFKTTESLMFGWLTGVLAVVIFVLGTWSMWNWYKDDFNTEK
jgi:hypothetical protein